MSVKRLFVFFSLSVMILWSLIGCSKYGYAPEKGNPIILGNENKQFSLVGVSDWAIDGRPQAGMGLLGLFSAKINPSSMTAEITPLRNNALTDVLEAVDITNFLQLSPCIDCVKLKSVSLDPYGHFVLSIGIKHPFKAGDPLKPITGRNRADLHVFNVEGIVVSNAIGISFPGIGQSSAGFNLVNADGYTSYLDDPLDDIYRTAATIHPYILHFDDYSAGNFNPSNPMGFESVTVPPPTGNLVMAMGCDYDYKDYVFDIVNDFEFIYAVGCTYAVSAANKSSRFRPEYRIPQHNKKAASEVFVSVVNNQLRGGITDSFADIEIRVVDVSHGVAVGTNLNEMLSDSSVDEISIEIPYVTSAPVMIDGSSSSGGSGHSPSDPLIYQVKIYNSAAGTQGSYTGLVKVRDSYSPGQNTSPLLNGLDGIKRVGPYDNPLTGLFDIDEFATYQVFTIDVGSACGPITGAIISPTCPLSGVNDDAYVNFEASASSANGGDPIVLYEWDMNYDGIPSHFSVDATGASVNLGPFDNPTCGTPNEQPVNYVVAVRATDSCVPPNVTIFATCTVTVDRCEDPYKNIPLIKEAWDLAVDRLDGRVLIIYKDGTVWQYKRDNMYQSPIPNNVYYDSHWFDTIIYNALRQPTNYQCVPVKAYLAISDNHWFTLSYYWYVNDWVDRAWFRVINADGVQVSHIVPKGNWSVSYSLAESMAFGSTGDHPNHFGVLWYCAVPDYSYFSHASPSNNYATEQYAYKSMTGTKTGVSNLWPPYVRGLEVDKNESSVWVVEDVDFYGSRWRFNNGTAQSYSYDNAFFGVGYATNADTGFNKPLDLTRTADNKMLVLDQLSTGTYRVKAFNVSTSPGTPAGGKDLTEIIGPARRIDCGDWVDPTDGNMLFVLHGSETDGWFMSIYRESELPW